MTRPVRAALTALGCKVNYAEMAELAGRLAAAGIELVGEDEPADVRVLNSCTVTVQADATTRQRISRLRRADPAAHLVLTGCSVDANPGRYPALVDSVFANADKEGIADHVLELAAARDHAREPVVAAPAPRRSRAFLKVQDGCDHRCTYCIVWRARGGVSRSVPLDEVLRHADAALAEGHRELVLTGVDLGSWGHERGERLSTLVGALLERVGGARLRLSSVNANDITPALAELNAHPRLCAHWHVPLQRRPRTTTPPPSLSSRRRGSSTATPSAGRRARTPPRRCSATGSTRRRRGGAAGRSAGRRRAPASPPGGAPWAAASRWSGSGSRTARPVG
ncbi:MAG: radical SAM protein [Chloroflexi bacterium]|nr:MAG: radical SAM protein [Chloroflexota bacterium]